MSKKNSVPTARAEFRQRSEAGRAARARVPRSSHGTWAAGSAREDPVAMLERQGESRLPELLPIRYARMLASPFAFFRGAAAIMAADLADTPTSGITVQLCGDAHLSNFGIFATPERNLIFDINDFDETLPGPWEWDLKRLVASFEVAARGRGFSRNERTAVIRAAARGYRERMRTAAGSPVLYSWHDRLDSEQVQALVRRERHAERVAKQQVGRTEQALAKARSRGHLNALSKLAEVVDGRLRIKAAPPLVVPLSDLLPAGEGREQTEARMRKLLGEYRKTLPSRSHPVSEYEYVDMARKVVGVGSVGTRAWVVLLRGRDDTDPLILQAKEAQTSVLEPFLEASAYANQGERVVRGQQLMQAASDMFLGWRSVKGIDGVDRDFYFRQLQDGKGSAEVERMPFAGMMLYARVCGETLARAHARGGDRVAIAGYLGAGEVFDRALGRFAVSYADRNALDHAAFGEAVASGRLIAAAT
ncbi:DUF2252 domain-containing protein [Microbacterium caowuchunii]|uniref:DUF2252 domain-containing protein n=1 Tax=Microbacterium caowuchunii TaxID=2614638 RepID=UPI00124540E6|nr:DUF2252 domain-containing protein [Microbacterium caowuchunii]QEV99297.1 DUF2252 domain-containing protein [Microbacterium caowuchunii]